MKQLDDYFKYNSFFSLLKDTRHYKEAYKSVAGRLSFFLPLLATFVLVKYYQLDRSGFFKKIDDVVSAFTPGLFGLLGIYIAGVSLVLTMLSKKTIDNLDKQKKVDALVDMFFAYYFAGACLLVTIVGFTFLHFRNAFNMLYYALGGPIITDGLNLVITVAACWFFTYVFFFSLTYTVSLLGLCINIFFANIYMDREFENEKRNNEKEKINIVMIREHD